MSTDWFRTGSREKIILQFCKTSAYGLVTGLKDKLSSTYGHVLAILMRTMALTCLMQLS